MAWLRYGGAAACALVLGCGPVLSPSDGSGTADGTTTSTTGRPTSLSVGEVGEVGPLDEVGEVGPAEEVSTSPPSYDIGTKPDFGDCLEWAHLGCGVLTRPSATVDAITPLGEYPGAWYVYFAAQTGCGGCVLTNVLSIYILPSPDAIVDLDAGTSPVEGLVFNVFDSSGFMGPVPSPVPGTLFAYRDGQEASDPGAVLVLDGLPDAIDFADPFAPDAAVHITGTLDLDSAAWSLHMGFDAAYCPQLNSYYICE